MRSWLTALKKLSLLLGSHLDGFSMHDIEMIHGINEHMTLTNLEAMVQFYRRLVVKTAG